MPKCYKCNKSTSNVSLVDFNVKCGLCKDYDNGFGERNPFPDCGCRVICWECEQKKCRRCGQVEDSRVTSDCKVCGRYNMDVRIDGSDTDNRGNWVDTRGRIIGSCEECVDCGMKTVCRDCAIAKFAEEVPVRRHY